MMLFDLPLRWAELRGRETTQAAEERGFLDSLINVTAAAPQSNQTGKACSTKES